jgi:hypothetical protein
MFLIFALANYHPRYATNKGPISFFSITGDESGDQRRDNILSINLSRLLPCSRLPNWAAVSALPARLSARALEHRSYIHRKGRKDIGKTLRVCGSWP